MKSKNEATLREMLLIAAVLAAAWGVLGTEALSLMHAIAFWPVLIWWVVGLVLLVLSLNRMRNSWRAWKWRVPRLNAPQWGLLLVIVVLMGWAACQALFSPPNNVDSNEYHLQRQVFWKQQRSVENYPTSNLRQLAMPPLTEFAGLHLMVLTGGDRFHNLVQWTALLLAALAVSLTTRNFGGDATAQLLAALWVVTIPLAFMQASNTKNDVVVLLWVCLLIYWVLSPASAGGYWKRAALIGLAFGALILTKGTGLIFGLPVAVLLIIVLFRFNWRRAAPALLWIGVVALSLNVGHFVRCYHTFDSIAPDKPGIHAVGPATLGNEDYSLGALVSGMLRNIGPHFVTPWQSWDDKLTEWMRTLHDKLGRNIDDPKTTWMPGGRFRPYQASFQSDEDKAAAPAHMLLLLLLPAVMIATRRQLPWKAIIALLAVCVAGFVLFSLLLKWQAWHVRLIIALPAIVAPVFGWSFGSPRMRYLLPLPVAILLFGLWPSMNSMQRPLYGPKSIFHADPLLLRCYYHPEWPQQYRALAERIEKLHPRVVGFSTGGGSPDYPIQRLLLDRLSPPPIFMSFNATQQIPGKPEPDPDVLLVRSNANRLKHNSTGRSYLSQGQFGPYKMFVPERGR